MSDLYLNEKLSDAVCIFIEGYGTAKERLQEADRANKLFPLLAIVESPKNFNGVNSGYLNHCLDHLRKDLLKYGSVDETLKRINSRTASRIMRNIYLFQYTLSDKIHLELKQKGLE